MKLFFLISSALLLTGCNIESATAKPAGRTETVIKVIDGDTFSIDTSDWTYPLDWKIRVKGIDTPEKGRGAKCTLEKERAKKATAYATALIRESGGRVRLINLDHDKYGGRLNADVYLSDGSNFAEEMIAAKHAKQYNGNGPKPVWCY